MVLRMASIDMQNNKDSAINHKIQCLSIGYGVILGALEVIAKRERYSQDNPLSVL